MTSLPASLPTPRTPDPREAPSLRWGILGTGWIADKFVSSLQQHSSQQVVAVGSRSLASATDFAQRFGIERAHGSYEELVADPGHRHRLRREPAQCPPRPRPAGPAGGQAHARREAAGPQRRPSQQIADEAARRGLFCMEAFWTAFLPKYDVLSQILDAGLLGDITAVVADFGEWFAPDHRIHRPELAGGPILDLATYLTSFVVSVLGSPEQITASATRTPTGVMGQTAMVFSTGDQQAVLHTTILANTPTAATIAGTAGTIVIDGPFYQPGPFTLTSSDGATRLRYDEPQIAHEGLHYQAAEVARRITAGESGSPLRPLAASLDVLRVMDEVRRQTGDLYPDEVDAG